MGVSFVRTIIIFALLVVSIRIMGKRQLGELEPIELVVAILISNLASQPLSDTGIPLVYGLVPVLTLLSCQIIISWLTVENINFRRIICGKPSILIENGRIIQGEMKKNRISLDELFTELRSRQITDITSVKRAILETDGTLSVILNAESAPVTPSQLNISVSEAGSPLTVISNGRTLSDNLRVLGLNEKWLQKELSARNVKSAHDVYIMTVDEGGNMFFALKDSAK